MTELIVALSLLTVGYYTSKKYISDNNKLIYNKNDLNSSNNRTLQIQNQQQNQALKRMDQAKDSKNTGVVGPDYLQSQITGQQIPVENFHNNMIPSTTKQNHDLNINNDYSNRTLENFTGQFDPQLQPSKQETQNMFQQNPDFNDQNLKNDLNYSVDISKNFSSVQPQNEKNKMIPFQPIIVPKGLGFGQNANGFSGYQQPNVLDYLTQNTPTIDDIRPLSQAKQSGQLPDIQTNVGRTDENQYTQALAPQTFNNKNMLSPNADQYKTPQPGSYIQQQNFSDQQFQLPKTNKTQNKQTTFGDAYQPNSINNIKTSQLSNIKKKNNETFSTPSMNLDNTDKQDLLMNDFGSSAQQIYQNQRSSTCDNTQNIPNPQQQNKGYGLNPDQQQQNQFFTNTQNLTKKAFSQINPRIYGNFQDDHAQGNSTNIENFIQSQDTSFQKSQYSNHATNRETIQQDAFQNAIGMNLYPQKEAQPSILNNMDDQLYLPTTIKETNLSNQCCGFPTGNQYKILQNLDSQTFQKQPINKNSQQNIPNPYKNTSNYSKQYMLSTKSIKQPNSIQNVNNFGQASSSVPKGLPNKPLNFQSGINNIPISQSYGLQQKIKNDKYMNPYEFSKNKKMDSPNTKNKQFLSNYESSQIQPVEKSYNQNPGKTTYKQQYQSTPQSDLDSVYTIPIMQNPYFPNEVKKIISQ